MSEIIAHSSLFSCEIINLVKPCSLMEMAIARAPLIGKILPSKDNSPKNM